MEFCIHDACDDVIEVWWVNLPARLACEEEGEVVLNPLVYLGQRQFFVRCTISHDCDGRGNER